MRATKITSPKNPVALDDDIVVPDGTPEWITPELIRETIATWQPFYSDSLTPEDAVTMLTSVGRLFAVLSRGLSHEALRRVGTGVEPRTRTRGFLARRFKRTRSNDTPTSRKAKSFVFSL